MSIRDDLKKARALPVTIDGLGACHVARLTVAAFRELKPLLQEPEKNMGEIVCRVLVDENGEPVFPSSADAEAEFPLAFSGPLVEAMVAANVPATKKIAGN